MPRKKIDTTSSTADVEVVLKTSMKELIPLLELDLGRDDLNKLVEKINEIIRRIN